jgi:hypothetical protein
METARQQKIVDLDRGLFLIGYESAGGNKRPPPVRVSPDHASTGDVTLILHPDQHEAVLFQPGSALFALATTPAKLLFDILFEQQNNSDTPSIKIEKLTQGDRNTRRPRSDGGTDLNLVDFRVLGHLAGVGDVTVTPQQWLAGPTGPSRIEGIQIDWPSKPADLDIRYAVKLSKPLPASGQMTGMGRFAGSRGKALPVIGVTLEMSGARASSCRFVVDAAFLGSPIKRVVGKRIVLSGPSERETLVGLRVSLEPATGGPRTAENPNDAASPHSPSHSGASRVEKRNRTERLGPIDPALLQSLDGSGCPNKASFASASPTALAPTRPHAEPKDPRSSQSGPAPSPVRSLDRPAPSESLGLRGLDGDNSSGRSDAWPHPSDAAPALLQGLDGREPSDRGAFPSASPTMPPPELRPAEPNDTRSCPSGSPLPTMAEGSSRSQPTNRSSGASLVENRKRAPIAPMPALLREPFHRGSFPSASPVTPSRELGRHEPTDTRFCPTGSPSPAPPQGSSRSEPDAIGSGASRVENRYRLQRLGARANPIDPAPALLASLDEGDTSEKASFASGSPTVLAPTLHHAEVKDTRSSQSGQPPSPLQRFNRPAPIGRSSLRVLDGDNRSEQSDASDPGSLHSQILSDSEPDDTKSGGRQVENRHRPEPYEAQPPTNRPPAPLQYPSRQVPGVIISVAKRLEHDCPPERSETGSSLSNPPPAPQQSPAHQMPEVITSGAKRSEDDGQPARSATGSKLSNPSRAPLQSPARQVPGVISSGAKRQEDDGHPARSETGSSPSNSPPAPLQGPSRPVPDVISSGSERLEADGKPEQSETSSSLGNLLPAPLQNPARQGTGIISSASKRLEDDGPPERSETGSSLSKPPPPQSPTPRVPNAISSGSKRLEDDGHPERSETGSSLSNPPPTPLQSTAPQAPGIKQLEQHPEQKEARPSLRDRRTVLLSPSPSEPGGSSPMGPEGENRAALQGAAGPPLAPTQHLTRAVPSHQRREGDNRPEQPAPRLNPGDRPRAPLQNVSVPTPNDTPTTGPERNNPLKRFEARPNPSEPTPVRLENLEAPSIRRTSPIEPPTERSQTFRNPVPNEARSSPSTPPPASLQRLGSAQQKASLPSGDDTLSSPAPMNIATATSNGPTQSQKKASAPAASTVALPIAPTNHSPRNSHNIDNSLPPLGNTRQPSIEPALPMEQSVAPEALRTSDSSEPKPSQDNLNYEPLPASSPRGAAKAQISSPLSTAKQAAAEPAGADRPAARLSPTAPAPPETIVKTTPRVDGTPSYQGSRPHIANKPPDPANCNGSLHLSQTAEGASRTDQPTKAHLPHIVRSPAGNATHSTTDPHQAGRGERGVQKPVGPAGPKSVLANLIHPLDNNLFDLIMELDRLHASGAESERAPAPVQN